MIDSPSRNYIKNDPASAITWVTTSAEPLHHSYPHPDTPAYCRRDRNPSRLFLHRDPYPHRHSFLLRYYGISFPINPGLNRDLS